MSAQTTVDPTVAAALGHRGAARPITAPTTRALLTSGAAAGLLLPTVGLIQAFTRQGFDLRRHYMSQLSTGDLGWIQIGTFIISGLLYIAFAVGLWRVLRPGRAGTVGPLLLAGYGLGLIAAGVFVPDPANGFPVGSPGGVPSRMSWHSVLHGAAAVVSFLFLVAACLVFAWRFGRLGQWGWMGYSIVSGGLCFAIPSAPGAWAGVTLFTGGLVGWVWVCALSLRLRNTPSAPASQDRASRQGAPPAI